jgi:hypothetical protein
MHKYVRNALLELVDDELLKFPQLASLAAVAPPDRKLRATDRLLIEKEDGFNGDSLLRECDGPAFVRFSLQDRADPVTSRVDELDVPLALGPRIEKHASLHRDGDDLALYAVEDLEADFPRDAYGAYFR